MSGAGGRAAEPRDLPPGAAGRPLRAAVVVTGSELVRGDRTDLNGPFLARSLLTLGVEPVQVRIVGDAPAELEAALRDGLAHDLLVCSGGDGDGIEVTICARDFETHVDLVVTAGAEARAEELERTLVASLDNYLFSRTDSPIEEFVLDACRARALTLGAAESCTGGLVA